MVKLRPQCEDMWFTLLTEWTILIYGTVATVNSFPIIENFYKNITHKKRNSKPKSGQKVKREQILTSYIFLLILGVLEEEFKCNKTISKLTDPVMLYKDIMKINKAQFYNTEVLKTVMRANIVYQSN